LFLKLLLHNKPLPRTFLKVYKYEPVCKDGEEYCGQPGTAFVDTGNAASIVDRNPVMSRQGYSGG